MISVEDWAEIRRLHKAEGLPVQERRQPGVEWWIEPEYALGRPIHLDLDVANQELVVEHPALDACGQACRVIAPDGSVAEMARPARS